jgi:hypothetical protein
MRSKRQPSEWASSVLPWQCLGLMAAVLSISIVQIWWGTPLPLPAHEAPKDAFSEGRAREHLDALASVIGDRWVWVVSGRPGSFCPCLAW